MRTQIWAVRLAQSSMWAEGHLIIKIYGSVVTERYRHRYEANVYLDTLRKSGLVISALSPARTTHRKSSSCQTAHPWFVGVQFLPSSNRNPVG
jgi:CTP synthase